MTLNPFHDTSLFYACWKHQEISDFLIYFGEYRKRAVAWNVLIKIFLANMSTECWYSCLFHNRACFLTVDLHSALVLSIPLKKCKVSMFLIWVGFKEHFSETASSGCSWQPIETHCFNYNIYFKGNQLKKWFFFHCSIYFKLIKITGLMYFLNESWFRVLFR